MRDSVLGKKIISNKNVNPLNPEYIMTSKTGRRQIHGYVEKSTPQ
jgi:hypothetical protein